MVANAGLFDVGPIVDVSVERWDRLHAVNVRGVMLCVKHAARQMIAQGRGGTIIRELPAVDGLDVGKADTLVVLAASSLAGIYGVLQSISVIRIAVTQPY